MILKTLSKNHPSNLAIFIILVIVLWIRVFLVEDAPHIHIDQYPMPFYEWIVQLAGPSQFHFIFKVFALLLVVIQGIFISGVISQFNLIGSRSFLPGIIYLLITANLPQYQLLHPVYFATPLVLLAWNQIVLADFAQNSYKPYFLASLLVGLATLFYPNYIYFVIVMFIGTFLNRIPKYRDFLMICMGVITVWYFYLTLFFLFTSHFNLSGIELDINFLDNSLKALTKIQVIFFIYMAFLIAAASIFSTRILSNQKVTIRKNLKILFIWFSIGLFIFFFTNSGLEIIYFVSPPVAVFLSLFFISFKGRLIKEIIFALLLIITVLNQFFPGLDMFLNVF
jgi:hypothetical protein